MAMELELQQLDLRYQGLRVRNTQQDKRLVASISEVGQLTPLAVVSSDEDHRCLVVIDGFARLRALRKLRQDVVRVIRWELGEVEALLLERSLRASRGETSLEQAWLLDELRRRFNLTEEELARQFGRAQSWISRRLGLVQVLPEDVQQLVRTGEVSSCAASKYLVPMARVSPDDCERMARAIAKHDLASRDLGQLYAGWRDADTVARERLLDDPLLFLRARRARQEEAESEAASREGLLKDVGVMGASARRASRRLRQGAATRLSPLDYEELFAGLRLAETEARRLVERLRGIQAQGDGHARSERADSRPRDADARAIEEEDREDAQGVALCGPEGDRVGDG